MIDKIKALMDENKIEMSDLIEKTNIKRSTLYYLLDSEENFKNAKFDSILKISKALNVSVDQLLKLNMPASEAQEKGLSPNDKGLECAVMLGEKLKFLRKSNNLTQQQLADKLRITQQTYARYENNTIEPNIESLHELAKFYNISLDYLLDDRTTEKNDKPFPAYNEFKSEMERRGITEEKWSSLSIDQKNAFYSTIEAFIKSFTDSKS